MKVPSAKKTKQKKTKKKTRKKKEEKREDFFFLNERPVTEVKNNLNDLDVTGFVSKRPGQTFCT